MAVKVPPLLHKMSMAAQKAWYKKHGMEMPSATAAGRSAAQAKKDVGEINKQKAREAAIAAAATASKKNKELVKSSERVRQMAANVKAFGGQRPGGDLTTASGMVNFIRSGGYLKAGRLGEEAVEEAVVKTKDVNKEKLKNYVRGLGTKAVVAGKVPFDQRFSPLRAGRKVLKQEEHKPDASMAMTHTLKMKALSDKDKRTLGKVAALMAAQKKKLKEEVSLDEVTKQEAEKALGGPVKTRTGEEPKGKLPLGFRAARNLARKAMKKGAPVNETGEYTNIGHPPEHAAYLDVDPTRSDPLELFKTRKKPAQFKHGMKNGVRIKEESTEEKQMNKGKLLAKAIMAKQSKHPIAQHMGEEVKDVADVGEYDYEGDMAKSQLRSILANAKRLHDMLDDQTNLPEWVQSKITLAQDYIMTAADYMEGEMNEETVRQEEAIFEAMKKMADEMDDEEEDDDMEDEEEMEDEGEEEEEDEDEDEDEKENGKKKKMDEKYVGFAKLKASIAAKGGARDPAAVAAAIGRKKYGKEKFQAMAAAGKKANEEVEQIDEVKAVKAYDKEGKLVGRYRSMDHAKQMKPGHTYKVEEGVVTEAEGKVAVTPKEKELAAHHGDPKKITYGDVIKARIKSAAEKAMNKGK